MDPVTQGAFGAIFAQTISSKKQGMTLEGHGTGIVILEHDVILKAMRILIIFQMNCLKNGHGQSDIQVMLKLEII